MRPIRRQGLFRVNEVIMRTHLLFQGSKSSAPCNWSLAGMLPDLIASTFITERIGVVVFCDVC